MPGLRAGGTVVVLLRFGFLALAVGATVHMLLIAFPMTTDPSAWYSGRTLLALVFCGALAVYGMRAALRRPDRTIALRDA